MSIKDRVRELRSGIAGHLWPLRVNKLLYLGRRARHRWKRIHLTRSEFSKAISVWELGRERRLVFAEGLRVAQSVAFTRGSWGELRREYWGRAMRPPCGLPDRPRVLILGLGGGTMVQLAQQVLRPRRITAVERDPVVVQVAREFMGLDGIPGLRVVVGDVHTALTELERGEDFDLIIEDVFYRGFPDEPDAFIRSYIGDLARVLSDRGALVFNRWFRDRSGRPLDSGQERLARLLGERFEQVARQRIAQRWQNELIFAAGLRSRERRPGAAAARDRAAAGA